MRRMIIVISLLALFLQAAYAVDKTFAWDPHPQSDIVTEFRLYEVQGANHLLLGTAAGGTTIRMTVDLVPREYGSIVLRAYSPDWGESGDSNAVSIGPAADSPTGLRKLAMVLAGVGAGIVFLAVGGWKLIRKIF